MRQGLKAAFAGVLLSALLAGCDSLPDYLGTVDEDPPLPGTRKSVLAGEGGLQPNPSLQDQEIRLPEPYVNANWSQTGGNESHALYHLALGDSPRLAWRADIGEGDDDEQKILAQPLVVDGTVYTMDALSTVSAFDAASGDRRWWVDLEPEDEDEGYFGGGLAYWDGRLFVTTGFGQVIALDAKSGGEYWRVQLPAPIRAAPAAVDGYVFAVSLENETVALNAENGETEWRHQGIQEAAALIGAASPAVSEQSVILAYSSGEIVAARINSGRVLWSDSLAALQRVDPIADLADIRGHPVVDRGFVLAISNSGLAVAIEARRGLRVWESEISGSNMPWAGGEAVYLLNNSAQLVALNRRDGRIWWVTNLPRWEDADNNEDAIGWYGPVLAGDRLLVAGSNEQVWSISPYTGKALGYIELPSPAALTPIVADKTLYIVTSDAELLAYR